MAHEVDVPRSTFSPRPETFAKRLIPGFVRESFAAHAMQALVARADTRVSEFMNEETEQRHARIVAAAAVRYADALCAELSKQ